MTLGIIQARMGSRRFPGKSMKKVAGIPLVELVTERVIRSKTLDKVVISTTGEKEDFAIRADFREPLPRDPLGGFWACAKHFGADIVVRLTADDPLKDPKIIDKVVGHLMHHDLEYCSNTLKPTFPWGLDVEAIRMETLERLNDTVAAEIFREHVTYYILEHPEKFKAHNITYKEDLHDWNWSIDTPEDLARMNQLLSNFDPIMVGYEEVIQFVKAHGKRAKVYTGSLAS